MNSSSSVQTRPSSSTDLPPLRVRDDTSKDGYGVGKELKKSRGSKKEEEKEENQGKNGRISLTRVRGPIRRPKRKRRERDRGRDEPGKF